jgi:hypothetical protein
MQPPEAFRLLTRRMPKRAVAFRLLSIIFMAASLIALILLQSIPWALVSLVASFLCIIAWVLIRQKCIAAWAVARNPQIVYWAHSRPSSRSSAYFGLKSRKILTLHLCDGRQQEFIIPTDDLYQFTDWLNERNPSVNWGAFYNPHSNQKP